MFFPKIRIVVGEKRSSNGAKSEDLYTAHTTHTTHTTYQHLLLTVGMIHSKCTGLLAACVFSRLLFGKAVVGSWKRRGAREGW